VKDIESRITEIMIETDRSSLAGGTKITRLVRELNEATILKVRFKTTTAVLLVFRMLYAHFHWYEIYN